MKFRKKPVVIEAIQWTALNWFEIRDFTSSCVRLCDSSQLVVPTLEGEMIAYPGDWIIKGIKGEFYPCKPDIFEMTYELNNQTEKPGEKEG